MKIRAMVLMLVSFFSMEIFAEYYLYMMNNTNEEIVILNTCDDNLGSSECSTLNNGKLPAFKRNKVHHINYDQGITRNHHYTLRTYFSLPGDENKVKNNYFSTTFEGDFIGSHITEIDVFREAAFKKIPFLGV